MGKSVTTGQILGHYRVAEKIGQGGMGAVWAAEDTKLQRRVALKLLPPEVVASPERRARFEREARAVARLNHPNIVTIHSVDESGGVFFITMELVEGRPLSKVLPKTGFDLERLFELALPMVDAVSAAHEHGITHRDLKPDNVMVGADGRVRILDFGLAKRFDEAGAEETRTALANSMVTEEGKVVGTVPYMSPEQAQGKSVDHRTDIFSLGILLYEMATGERPFRGDNTMSVLSSIIKDTPAEITNLKRSLPRHLGRVVRRCLDKDPERRFQRARDLYTELDDLRQEITRDEIRASTTSSVRTERAPRRVPWVAASVFVALLAIAVSAVLVLRRSAPDTPDTPATEETRGASAVETSVASVAVLPFVNMSTDAENEIFSDGMTEELINALVKIEGLRVPARTSVFAFKGKNVPIGEIGKSLGVGHVLEGSVRKAGSQLRVTAQLVAVEDGFHVWSDTYDRELKDIFTIQEEIAEAIVGNLRVTLAGGKAAESVIEPPTEDIQAHELYLQGRFYWNRQTEDDLVRSIEYFQQALERDPGFALAWVGLASSYDGLANNFRAPREYMPKAKAAVEKALELDAGLAAAHVKLGDILLFYYWDWPGRLFEYQRAIELDPQNPEAHIGYGTVLTARGRFEEGLVEARLAERLLPFSAAAKNGIGLIYYFAGENEEAVRIGRDMLEADPNLSFGHALLGLAYTQLGAFDEAVAAAEESVRDKDDPITLAFLVHTYAFTGRTESAMESLAELLQWTEAQYVCPYEVATAYVGFGDHDKAIEWFEKAYEARADCWIWGFVDPRMAEIRKDERYRDLLRRVGHAL